MTPDGKTILVAGFGTNQVMLIDVATNKVTGQVAVPQPHNIAITPDGKTAYVASQQQGATALAILSIADEEADGQRPARQDAPRAEVRQRASNSTSRSLVRMPCRCSIRRRIK